MTLHYRTVFVSDVHLGSRYCQAEVLSRFLKHVRCERLYLVGDILDMWRLRQRWHWPGEHNNVIRRILNHTKHRTDVVFIPGNHDEGARQFLHMEFGGVRVLPYAIHHTADGRRLLVTHGDQYDLVVQHSRLLSMLGGTAYEYLILLNQWVNAARRRLGLPSRSLSKAIKLKVKRACTFISNFEEALTREAQQRGLDGVVCGHIHQAECREDQSIAYYNCGDWMEGTTAIVEHMDGRMELIDVEDALAAMDTMNTVKRRMPLDEELPSLAELISWNHIAGSHAHDDLRVSVG